MSQETVNILLILGGAAAIGGAIYYYKVYKPQDCGCGEKQSNNSGGTPLVNGTFTRERKRGASLGAANGRVL